ncbi:MAG TPA: hypothetical protein H9688_01900 [Firmicutes bacterium]|nr:hypothetical protein [Bacillota bacterium]
MGAEVLIYGYGLVCLSMLVFNVIYGLHLRSDDKRLKKRIDDIFNQVEKQIENIHEGKPLQNGHSKWMRKKLSKVNYLIAFDHFLDEHNSDDEDFQKYLQNLQPVFFCISPQYIGNVRRRRRRITAIFWPGTDSTIAPERIRCKR